MTHFKAINLTALLLVLILLVSMFSTTALAAEDEYITDFEAESEIIIEEEPAVELPEAEESSEEVSEIEESSEVSDAPTSGTIPDSNIQWELTDDGMLLISGSGGCAAAGKFYGKILPGETQGLQGAALKAGNQIINFLVGHGGSFLHGKCFPRGETPLGV